MDLFVFILIRFCVLMSLTSELENLGPKFILKMYLFPFCCSSGTILMLVVLCVLAGVPHVPGAQLIYVFTRTVFIV